MSQDSVENRILKHNSSSYESSFTTTTDDWELYFSVTCVTVSQARKIELHIKKAKSRTYITNLKKYPEMIEKLLIRYS